MHVNITAIAMIKNGKSGPSARQSGVVLLIALIVLIAMTLSALSLIRSVGTTNLISGNLAFRESAVLSSEHATESALNDVLIPGSEVGKTTLHNDIADYYWAKRADPAADQNWETFWNSLVEDGDCSRGAEDVAGNHASYVIHRLCEKSGPPAVAKCSEPPLTSHDDSKGISGELSAKKKQVYYRITSRVCGPRNTVIYTQTIVAL